MKCSEKVTRYEHKNIIVVVEEKLDGEGSYTKSRTTVQFHKRAKPADESSHWKGSLDEIRELGEAVASTLLTLAPDFFEPKVEELPMETLNAGEGPRAEPPKPGEGDVVIQMTIEQFNDILDVSNEILSNPSDKRSSKLALMVNKAMGGRTIY